MTTNARSAHRALAVVLAAALVAGCAPRRAPARPAVNHVVEMMGLAFQPADLEVAPGDTVTWVNRDIVPHTATSTDVPRAIDTATLAAGDSARFIAAHAGVYRYTCTFHPTMQGRLVVRAATAPGDRLQP